MPACIGRTVWSAFVVVIVLSFQVLSFAQATDNVAFKVAVVDKALSLRNVPKFVLLVSKPDDAGFVERRISTSVDGTVSVSLPPGTYAVCSERPLEFENKTFSWRQNFTVKDGKTVTIELSNDNATLSESTPEPAPRRRVSEEGDMFKTLRGGVVTVEGELGTGTGFIIDENGMVLTNQHVIAKSNEIRVRIDKQTAVKARLLAEDADRDVAVLQINLKACADCLVLKIAKDKPGEPTVVEGERVFTIGSPLFQDKILTSGIVSKVEAHAIISDININPGNSGGPLFNSLGEVVGLTTFGVQAQGGPGIAGIVRIEQAEALVQKAQDIASAKGVPSGNLLPRMPDGSFPVETIKAQIDVKKFPQKPYKDDVKDYQINYITPVFKFFVSEKDRLESLKKRDKRNKDKGAMNTVDRFKDLRNWNEYAGQLKPVVEILALPEVTATGKSMLLTLATTIAAGIPTPLDMKFKADFYQMKLICSGEEITPLRRNKTEFGVDLQNYYKVKTRYTYAGVYTYPYEVFEPGKCNEMEVQIFSEEDIEKPIIARVRDETKARIWADFVDYRQQTTQQLFKSRAREVGIPSGTIPK
jgi:S1-C subfamily serine protease